MIYSETANVRNSRGNGVPVIKHVITRVTPEKTKKKRRDFFAVSSCKLVQRADLCSTRTGRGPPSNTLQKLLSRKMNPFYTTGIPLQTPFASRGAARAAEVTTRENNTSALSCATVTRARARRSYARLFGAGGRRQFARHARLNCFCCLKNKKTKTLTHSLPARCGLMRRSVYGVSRVMYPSRRYKAIRSPERRRLVGEKPRAWRRRRR
jgi:hypothetical protein